MIKINFHFNLQLPAKASSSANPSLTLILMILWSALSIRCNHPAEEPSPALNSESQILDYQALPSLAWENASKETRPWSLHIFQTLWENDSELLSQNPEDASEFCPTYGSLAKLQRLEFWAHLITAITKFESSYRPQLRYLETTLGLDSITGEPVVSEGLLQLSYQDSKIYKNCQFVWNQDRELARDDPRKSILNPLINLTCGISILNAQIKNKGRISLSQGAYWSVLKIGHANSRLAEIKSSLAATSVCQRL